MDGSDDVDEDELALAMSTELSRPSRALVRPTDEIIYLSSGCRGKSPTQYPLICRNKSIPPFSDYKDALTTQKTQLTGLEPKPIRIHDRSLDDQDKDNPDGLWASSVTVTEPSIVKGNQGQGLQAVSGYVGSSCSTFLY